MINSNGHYQQFLSYIRILYNIDKKIKLSLYSVNLHLSAYKIYLYTSGRLEWSVCLL